MSGDEVAIGDARTGRMEGGDCRMAGGVRGRRTQSWAVAFERERQRTRWSSLAQAASVVAGDVATCGGGGPVWRGSVCDR